ncbi:MAG TPA: NAD(P)/FAD-dependent oxidoreductase [Rhodospirillales bacterium]|jgi:NADPH-dependent 2,4-dienoyl-CoA reductase/sulfur reductase-like enzyme|nr:NAD(P)/FAD-dependent oxidoreductase [Rhodospirillales bacterium]
MKPYTRRNFGKLAGAAATAAIGRGIWPGPALGKSKPKAVIIGGGAGGATAARRLAEDFQDIDVTLIEANKQYTACFFASRYLGGIRTLADVTHGYRKLAANPAITVINAAAAAIDGDKKTVILGDGTRLGYDRLIVAPGIEIKFDLIDGYDEKTTDLFPHAYKADAQISILKKQLEAMDDGGLFAISSPSRPYRCPPAPYERAAMAAFYLKKHKPRSKIQILDSKDEFPMSEVMSEVWDKFYPGMIEWVPAEFGGKIRAVDVKAKTLISSEERFTADVLNIIPDQHAGRIAQVSGLAGKNGWCPIHAKTFESRLIPGIHVVGDAIDPGDMSKSAFSANSQARACAAAVGAALTGKKAAKSPLTNTCFFLVSQDHGLKLGGTYKPTPEGLAGLSGYLSQVGEDLDTRLETAKEGDAWYAAVTKEMFS